MRLSSLIKISGTALLTGQLMADSLFSLGIVQTEAGMDILLPVSFNSNDNITALQTDLLYDARQVHPGEISLGSVSSPTHLVTSHIVSPGRQRIIVYSNDNSVFAANGVILQIPFQVDNEATGITMVGLDALRTISRNPIGEETNSSSEAGAIQVIFPDDGLPDDIIRNLQIAADGSATFEVHGPANTALLIEESLDLITWSLVNTLEFGADPGPSTQTVPEIEGETKRFYRIRVKEADSN